MQSLRQRAFTGDQRRSQCFEALHCPGMVKVRAIEQRHQRSGVSKTGLHFLDLPKERIRVLLTDRSPSLLAPRFLGFSNRSWVSWKQLTGAAASLSRDNLSRACNISRVSRSEERRVGKECRARW